MVSIILPTPTPSVIKHGGKLIGHADDVIRHGDEVVDVVKHLDDPPLYHYTDPSGAAHIGNTGQIEPHPQLGLPYVFGTFTSPSNMDIGRLGDITGKPGATITHAFEIHGPKGWNDFFLPNGEHWAIHDPPVPVKPVGQLRWEFMTDGNPLTIIPVIQK